MVELPRYEFSCDDLVRVNKLGIGVGMESRNNYANAYVFNKPVSLRYARREDASLVFASNFGNNNEGALRISKVNSPLTTLTGLCDIVLPATVIERGSGFPSVHALPLSEISNELEQTGLPIGSMYVAYNGINWNGVPHFHFIAPRNVSIYRKILLINVQNGRLRTA